MIHFLCMYLCELFSVSGSVYSKDCVQLRPRPENIVSAAVMKKVLFLLVNEKTIAVYAMEMRKKWNGRYDETVDNRMNEINLQDLGLATDCKLQRIWAGDTESETCVLHVLYQREQDKILTSYNMNCL